MNEMTTNDAEIIYNNINSEFSELEDHLRSSERK